MARQITNALTLITVCALFYALFVFTCALDNSCSVIFMQPM